MKVSRFLRFLVGIGGFMLSALVLKYGVNSFGFLVNFPEITYVQSLWGMVGLGILNSLLNIDSYSRLRYLTDSQDVKLTEEQEWALTVTNVVNSGLIFIILWLLTFLL